MNYICLNILPIFVAAVAGFLFSVSYYRMARHTPVRKPVNALFLTIVFIVEFWIAAILAGALILSPQDQAGPWVMAIGTAVILWIGFVFPAIIVDTLLQSEAKKRILLQGLHWLGVLLIMAMVTQYIGVEAPKQ
jgi:hypothetical protein